MATADTELKPPPDITTETPEETKAKGDILKLGEDKATLAKGYEESVKQRAGELESALNKPKPTAPETPDYPKPPSQKIRPFAENTPGEPWQITANKAIMQLGLLAQGVGGLVSHYPQGALAAMQGAYEGWAQGDKERGDREFKQWGALTEQMKDKYEQDRQHFQDLMSNWQGDVESVKAKLALDAAKMGASKGAIEALQQNPETILQWAKDREKLSLDHWRTYNELALKRFAQIQRDEQMTEAKRLNDAKIAHMKKQEEQMGGSAGLTPAALDMMVDQVLSGQPVAQVVPGWGQAGVQTRSFVLNKVAEKMKERGIEPSSLAGMQAAYSANRAALAQITKLKTMVGSFEQTAQKNLVIVQEMSKKTDRFGVPIADKWLLAGKRATGDPDVSAYDAAIRTASNEVARVVNSANGSGVLSDTARKEIESILNPAMAPEQIESVIGIMKRDMDNRIQSLTEGQANILKEIGPPKPKETPGQPAATHRYNPQTGQVEEIK